MLDHPDQGVGEGLGRWRIGHRRVDVLRLAAVAVGLDDQLAGEPPGDLGPAIEPNDVQAQIEAGRAAGRSEDVALVDVEHQRIDGDRGVCRGEHVALGPVRDGAPTVEQSGAGQHERAGAQRDYSRAAGVGPADRGHGGVRDGHRVLAGRHDHGVGATQGGQPARHLHRHAVVEPHRIAFAADDQVVPRQAQHRALDRPEDLARG
jgi:hypothetical protein